MVKPVKHNLTPWAEPFRFSPWIFGTGLLTLVLGFAALTLVDQNAENIWGFIAPALIVGSYIVMALAFLF